MVRRPKTVVKAIRQYFGWFRRIESGVRWSASLTGVRLRTSPGLDATRDFFDEKLLKEGADGSGAGADEPVVNGEAGASVGGGIVGVGEAGGGEVAEDVGVVGLPVAVVSLADDDGGYGVEGSGDGASSAFVEVAWVLVEERGKDGAAEHSAGEAVSVGG